MAQAYWFIWEKKKKKEESKTKHDQKKPWFSIMNKSLTDLYSPCWVNLFLTVYEPYIL